MPTSLDYLFTAQTFTEDGIPVLHRKVGLPELQTAESKATMFTSPTFTGTVSGVDKTMVGLPNVDNTSDANKPYLCAQAIVYCSQGSSC